MATSDKTLTSVSNYISKMTGSAPDASDTNNCVLKAISAVEAKPYSEVKPLFHTYGRGGTRTHEVVNYLNYSRWNPNAGGRVVPRFKYKRLDIKTIPQRTVGSFAKANPVGKFVILVSRHCVSVVDGVILDDWNSSKRRILSLWKLN
jgi:hypothetical protein